jgi:hypothetical protein
VSIRSYANSNKSTAAAEGDKPNDMCPKVVEQPGLHGLSGMISSIFQPSRPSATDSSELSQPPTVQDSPRSSENRKSDPTPWLDAINEEDLYGITDPSTLLKDNIINSVLEMLIALRPTFRTIRSSYFTPHINNNNPVSALKYKFRDDTEGLKVIIIINPGDHWVCVFFDISERQISSFDSLPSAANTEFTVTQARSFVEAVLSSPWNNWEDWTFREQPWLRQSNHIDCGVYALAAAASLVSGMELPMHVNPEH